jgi:hypothetical protein
MAHSGFEERGRTTQGRASVLASRTNQFAPTKAGQAKRPTSWDRVAPLRVCAALRQAHQATSGYVEIRSPHAKGRRRMGGQASSRAEPTNSPQPRQDKPSVRHPGNAEFYSARARRSTRAKPAQTLLLARGRMSRVESPRYARRIHEYLAHTICPEVAWCACEARRTCGVQLRVPRMCDIRLDLPLPRRMVGSAREDARPPGRTIG